MRIFPGRLPLLAIATVAACVVGLTAQTPEQFVIDPAMSTITLQVGKTGLFSVAGHEHEIVAPVSEGEIALDRLDVSRSRISIRFDARALKVTGKGEPAGDVAEVQQVMLSDRVLNVQRFPAISFTSRTMSATKRSGDRMTVQVAGDLALHGVTRPLTLPVNVQLTADQIRADGNAVVRQTEFGIQPVKAGGGTVKVKDEVEVSFSVVARRR
jgi:polyisoprenoid-binding protein YceI